jgi:hypothetical protein
MSFENLPERLPSRRTPKEIIELVLQARRKTEPLDGELTRIFGPARKKGF